MLTFRDITLEDRALILPMVEDFYQGDAVLHPVETEIMERSFQDAADPLEPLLRGILIEVDGKTVVELDKLNEVYKVNGVDVLAKIKEMC